MVGGAIGSALRFAVSVAVASRVGEFFPWGTLVINISGSFVIGLFMGLFGPDGPLIVSPVWRAFVAIGICGGFTTFSSFSFQTMTLVQNGQWLWAAGNVVLSVVLCLLATAGGLALANVLPLRS